jgi:two-component system, NarL family, sensor kinase
VHTDPERALALLADLRSGIRSSLNDVRRVAYGLRPLDLDRHGLVGALEATLASLRMDGDVHFEMVTPSHSDLPELSPAIELAAYRITSEGIANVLRHSDATRCWIVIEAGAALRLLVSDDGTPPARWATGVGISSILQRAEELGGTASVGVRAGRWQVEANIPLASSL